jgi:hypothetical protein
MWDLITSLVDVLFALLQLALEIFKQVFHWSLALFWLAWSLWAIDWRKLGPVLSQGGAVPLVLIAAAVGIAWAGAAPSSMLFVGLEIPNYWWQLGVVGLLLTGTLAAGWLQLKMGWFPQEVTLAPESSHPHGHHHHHHNNHEAHHGHHNHSASHSAHENPH